MTEQLYFTLSPVCTQKLYEALLCLSKFSDLVSLEARSKQLWLSALNSTKSAYGAVHLSADRFFDEYKFVPEEGTNRFMARLQVKALLSVFRQRYLDSKDKSTSISSASLRLESPSSESSSRAAHRINIKLHCNHGVLKTYSLTYEACDIQHALFNRAEAKNHWRISSSLLREYLEHFTPRAEQLSITSASGRAAFTSFTEKLIDGKEILKQPLQTSVALDTADFEEWEVDEGGGVAISLKDFKAIAGLAVGLDSSVEAWYSRPGRPMQVGVGREGMEVLFTLMTAGEGTGATQRAAMGKVVQVQRRMEETAPQRSGSIEAKKGQEPATIVDDRIRQPITIAEERAAVQQQDQSYNQSGSQPKNTFPQQTPSQLPSDNNQEESPYYPAPASAPRSESNDSSLYRMPPPRLPPTFTPRTQHPPIFPTPPPADIPLFLPYGDEEEEDDDGDLRSGLDDERGGAELGWDTQRWRRGTEDGGARKRTRRALSDDEDDDDDDSGVGPTQQSEPVPKGLFD